MQIATNNERIERLFRVRPFIETSDWRDYGVEMALSMNREILMVRVRNHFVFATNRAWLECYLHRAIRRDNERLMLTHFKPERLANGTAAVNEFLRGHDAE